MPAIDLVIEGDISTSTRAQQVSSMFDVPPAEKARLEWHGQMPIEEKPWHVGLIVGPSGSGKSTILRKLWGEPAAFKWTSASVIDDFDKKHSVEDIARICQAVGFNTIPAWLRPYGVLSNGEKFRVDLARRLLEGGDPMVCDEFTSVVDRQVARIGAHAVQKFVRKHDRRFIAATCHFDLEDWLQPDWIFDPATMVFRWRSVQRRPGIQCSIVRAPYLAWHTFARFHYLTATLHKLAHVYVLAVDGVPAACAAVMHIVHPTARNIFGMSRLVTLPDYQGLGLAFVLADRVASAYVALGRRYHAYPAHPSLLRSFDHSPLWQLVKKPGFSSISTLSREQRARGMRGGQGGRPNAVFEYCGPPMNRADAAALIVT